MCDQIKNTNNELLPNHTLPPLEINDLLNLSRILPSKNGTHIIVKVEVPIISKVDSVLSELIPLPFNKNGGTVIFNINSKLIIIDSKNNTKIMPRCIYDECEHFDNITVCNSMLVMNLENPTECIMSILSKKSINCAHKYISNQNYWIKLFETSAYCYILSPIKMKVACGDSYKIHNLTFSQELDYREECDIYQMISEMSYNSTTQTTIEIIRPYLKLNFSIYDSIYKNIEHKS